VSTISKQMMRRLKSKGVDDDRSIYFPNWANLTTIVPSDVPSSFRAKLDIPQDAIVALYSGSLAGKQGLQLIPEAAKKLAHRKDIYFVICGDGVFKPQLESACAGLTNVRMLGLQPIESLSDLLSLADVHLLTQSSDAEDLVMPSKLLGMLASGRAIIATCREDTEIADVIAGRGIVVKPNDLDAFAAAIVSLADNGPARKQMGVLARQTAEESFGAEAVLSRLEAEMCSMFTDSQPNRQVFHETRS
jgi:colanic acid biosynthesis glycosyl transferase WcaI